MQDTPFTKLLAGMKPDGSCFSLTVPGDWLQGRTAYGGLSAALAYEAAIRAVPGLPPLRSAQFAFVGPAVGLLSITATVLRQGKSTVFMGVDLVGEMGLATRALLCFGASRESTLHHHAIPMQAVAAPDACPDFLNSPERPGFSRHFDSRLAGGARPRTPGADPSMLLWFKHRDADVGNSIAGLIAIADAPPPAAMVLFREFGPISTMTWTIDLLADAPASPSGWWLIRAQAQTAAAGYSAQDMTIWDDGGHAIATMRQTVAIFV